MKPIATITARCFFVAWMLGWATAVFAPSTLIAALALSPRVTGQNLFLDTFAVADEVSPVAKLLFAALFAAFLIVARMRSLGRPMVINAAIGMVSIMLVVAVLPQDCSRGFGIGLNGIRFDPLPTAIYLGGGLLSGVVFSIVEARCRARSEGSARV
jgi:hypothetical protein